VPPPTQRRFTGADPEELVLVEEIARRQARKQRRLRPAGTTRRGCLRGVKNARLRRKALHCVISGGFLIIVLSICTSPVPLPPSPG